LEKNPAKSIALVGPVPLQRWLYFGVRSARRPRRTPIAALPIGDYSRKDQQYPDCLADGLLAGLTHKALQELFVHASPPLL